MAALNLQAPVRAVRDKSPARVICTDREANERQALLEALAIGAGRCSSPAFGSGR